jgi:hypothetical protein
MASLIIRKASYASIERTINGAWISSSSSVSHASSLQNILLGRDHASNQSVKPQQTLLDYRHENAGSCITGQGHFGVPKCSLQSGFRSISQNIVPSISWSSARFFSDSSKQNPNLNPENSGQSVGSSGEDSSRGDSEEIEVQTVERDMSAVANELRQELNQLRKTIYDLSKGIALLGLAQLSCGAWLHWVTKAGPLSEISMQSFFAFAFPFTFAFLLRQVLKPMTFFTKMEEQGRLQILTLSLQVTKGVIALFRRLNVVVLLCAAGISAGLLANAWTR